MNKKKEVLILKLNGKFVALAKITTSNSINGLIRKLKKMVFTNEMVKEVGTYKVKKDITSLTFNDIENIKRELFK